MTENLFEVLELSWKHLVSFSFFSREAQLILQMKTTVLNIRVEANQLHFYFKI